MRGIALFVHENYCRIHHKIDSMTLGEKFDMGRNALLGAKIDSEEGCVATGTGSTNVHEQVTDKTKELTARSGGLVVNLRGYQNDIRREKIRMEKKANEEAEYEIDRLLYS